MAAAGVDMHANMTVQFSIYVTFYFFDTDLLIGWKECLNLKIPILC